MSKPIFDEDLKKAAKQFILDVFEDCSTFTEDQDIIITTAMCIIEDESYFQELKPFKYLGGN